MRSGLFDDFGGADPTLNGAESRILRAMLTLERRHIGILAGIVAGDQDVTTDRVTQWERSTGRGYPPELVTFLRHLIGEIQEMGRVMGDKTGIQPDGRCLLSRPEEASLRLLFRNVLDRDLTDAEDKALTEGGGDFWQRLSDAMVIEAARVGYNQDLSVHVRMK